MKEIKVSVNTWYVVEGTAGATVINPSTNKAIATVEDGKQTAFYATTPYVLVSDDSVNVFKATFNSAPAKLRLLGLLGGGASASALPNGYLAADFLQNAGGAYIDTKLTVTRDTGAMTLVAPIAKGGFMAIGCQSVEGSNKRFFAPRYRRDSGEPGWGWGEYFDRTRTEFLYVKNIPAPYPVPENVWQTQKLNYKNNKLMELETDVAGYTSAPLTELPYAPGNITIIAFAYHTPTGVDYIAEMRMRKAEITRGDNVVFSAVPAIDSHGVPCMYDAANKETFRNSGSDYFIAGLTLAQARKLGSLPASGGALHISLPTGYESDAGVDAALKAAAAKGWNITERTHDAGDSAVATFGMRRIWVRRTQNDYGMYVDADGTRWHIDWCVGMHNHDGSEPDAHGYELFRSVDAAVSYWELEPYVDPEQEELLTAYNKNEQ